MNYLLLCTVMLLGMISPGPDLLLVVRNACSGNRTYGLGTGVGITFGILVHLAYCVLGLGVVIANSIWLYSLIKYAGAFYLIWIGLKGMLTKQAAMHATTDDIAPVDGLQKTFARGAREGFWCNLLNPKATVFFVSVISQFFTPETGVLEALSYCVVIVGLNTVYWCALVLLLQRRWMQSWIERAGNRLDRVFGAVLVALGARVALSD